MANEADDFILPSSVKQQRDVGSEKASDFALPSSVGAEPSDADWENMPKMEVASRALAAAPQSAWNAIKAIPEAIYNYEETGEGLKQIGKGLKSKAAGWMGEVQDPGKKAEEEAVVNSIMAPYSSVAGFKKALATDPFSVLSTAAIPLTGGASGLGAASEALGIASTAGKIASAAGKVAKVGAAVADPLTGVVGTGKLLAEKVAVPSAKKAASIASGLGPESIDVAYQAGKSPNVAIRDSFNTWAKGEGNPVNLSQDMALSASKLEKDMFKEWKSTKEGILASKVDVPFDPVFKAIQDARDFLGPRQTAIGSSAQAHRILDNLEDKIATRAASAQGSPERSLAAFDQLKRSLWNDAKRLPPMAETAYHTVRNGVSDAIGSVAPTYPSLMLDFPAMKDSLNTIRTTLGTKDKVAATTEILKLIKAQNDVTKNQFISQLAKYDPTLPYKIAGAAINQAAGHPSGWTQALNTAQWANLIAGIGSLNPMHVAGALGGIGTQKILGSPENIGKAAYMSGQASRAIEPIMESPITKSVPYLEQAATAPLMKIQNDEERMGRKSGGRVTTSDKLVAMADRAKKNINNNTQQLLKTPDTHVAQALEIANRNLEG